MIECKLKKHPEELLGIYGEGDCKEKIAAYMDTHDRIKIMATFDAIPKVCKALTDLDCDPYNRIHLVIDE